MTIMAGDNNEREKQGRLVTTGVSSATSIAALDDLGPELRGSISHRCCEIPSHRSTIRTSFRPEQELAVTSRSTARCGTARTLEGLQAPPWLRSP